MKDIQLYIDSGWYTVPYDTISYDQDGKKLAVPARRWKDYRRKRNTEASPAGALITGEASGVLVIDCDNNSATQLILDKAKIPGVVHPGDLSNEGVEDYVGLVVKTKRGHHLYFKSDEDVEDAKGPKIDVQATDKKLIYLASDASEGKKIIACDKLLVGDKRVINLHPMPKSLKEFVISLKGSKEEISAQKTIRYTGGTPLAKLDRGSKAYYKRLIPQDLKNDPVYRKMLDEKGYIHPNDIRDGMGNDYLISLAGIFAADPTIDVDAFYENMEFINEQWINPMLPDKLVEKIKPYAEGKYIPFNYDEDWEKAQYSFLNNRGEDITIMYDDSTSHFLVINNTKGEVQRKSPGDIVTYYSNKVGVATSSTKIATMIPSIETTTFDPNEPFGLRDHFVNVYKHSKYMDILNDKELKYTREEIVASASCKVLVYFKHLFGDQTLYWLRFLKRKLTTFEYSSTIFYLYDRAGGAGKNGLQTLLNSFVGFVDDVEEKNFKDKFTGQYENKLFVFHHEYSDERRQRRENTDKWKNLSGAPLLKIENKGKDVKSAINFMTIFVASNRLSVEIKDKDRRFCVVNCDKKFDEVFNEGYFKAMTSDEELSKLAIYLRYEVEPLNHKEYMQPPMSDLKEDFTVLNASLLDLLKDSIAKKDWHTIEEMFGRKVLLPHFDALDLKAIADKDLLNMSSRAFYSDIRARFGKESVKRDTNRRIYTDTAITYMTFPKGSMGELLMETPKKHEGETRI